jgi:hypothetical protein
MATEYPPMTSEERALFARVGTPQATEDDLIAAATFEADHALRSLPPHCLPTEGGLPHNEDHANASAHRCWSFLCWLAEKRRAPGNVLQRAEAALGEPRMVRREGDFGVEVVELPR